MSALEIRNIQKRYGEIETLKGIDIALESGEFLVLLGSSGCGKSTLLNIIAGLAEPSGGDILIDDRSIVKAHPKDRDIAMVFQSYALYPNMNVARNIGFGLEMRKVPTAVREKTVEDVAKLLQIESLLTRKPSQLSGGQRQRVAIGRALVRNPKVFLFDEPLSNLDAKLRTEMRVEIKRLHKLLKTTVVYVTHDQIEAMTLATRVAVMRDGQVEQLGTPAEIYNRPASLYVATFVGSPQMNILDATSTAEGLSIDGYHGQISLPQGTATPGQTLKLGIRPEALRLSENGAEGSVTLAGIIEIVEMTGPEQHATIRIGAQKLTASLAPYPALVEGQACSLSFDLSQLHKFDADSGQSLS